MTFQAIPILPAADVQASLDWWISKCGFAETCRDATPPTYAVLERDGAHIHLAAITDGAVARNVGDQTMVRFSVGNIDGLYAEYRRNGGTVHPNGALQNKPWGTREFAAIDPNGVCVTFVQLL